MCGICGWVDFERDLEDPRARREIAEMTGALALRGPDAEGVWIDGPVALGHRRLAVIDLEGGRQPMILKENGRPALALVYSGEIYNYRELRERLLAAGRQFETKSDTEVLLHTHREWGRRDPVHALRELNGMFAYALWDCANQELLLVRDRLGIKPLYYYPTKHGVLFGSEPKAILANSLAQRVVDADGLRRALGHFANPHNSVLRGLREVPPGHVVRVKREGISQLPYWRLTDSGHTDDVAKSVRHIAELLEDITRRQLISDVPLCMLLSGGLDSSSLTALAARCSDERIRSFAVDFVGHTDNFVADNMVTTPDGPYVHELAKFAGTQHSDITLSPDQLMDADARSATLRARDLPMTVGNFDTSLYLLFQAIREHSTVALSGEAADEVFGGYFWFNDPTFAQADTFPWLAGPVVGEMMAMRFLNPGMHGKLELAAYTNDQYLTALAEAPAIAGPAATDPYERRMREVSYLALTRFLPTMLDRKDRLSMAVGLEVRVPYCDHRLVEYVFATPWAHKTFDGREKGLLRAAVADLLPRSVANRVKSGYPAIQDPAYDKLLQRHFTALLNDRHSAVAPLLAVDSTRAVLKANDQTVLRGRRLEMERFLALENFLTIYNVSLAL